MAVSRVRAIFEEAVRGGVRADLVRGATEELIEQTCRSQRIVRPPHAVREIWTILGADSGPFWSGEKTHLPYLDGEIKEMAIDAHADTGGGLADPNGLLVLLLHSAEEFHVVDGSDIEMPDPPVWRIQLGSPITKPWASVTDWFRSAANDVLRMKAELERLRATGGSSSREKYFAMGA